MAKLYLALGDSLTAGYGVGLNHSFATKYYQILKLHGSHLSYLNAGVNGQTIEGLAHSMNSNHRSHQLIAQADLITFTIGSNDLLAVARSIMNGQPLNLSSNFDRSFLNLDKVGMTIRSLNQGTLIQIASIYNPLPVGPFQHLSSQAQGLINQLNHGLASWSKKYNAILVPVDRALHGKEYLLVGTDFLHPNVLGHEVIAKQFAHYR